MSSQAKGGNEQAATKQPEKTAAVTNKKPEAPVLTMPPAVIEIPPLEDRLYRIDQLFEIRRKYNKLQESSQKLSEFEIKKDGERSRLSISDDNRNTFETYNPEIIAEVISFMQGKIKEKVKALEPQLRW